MNLIHLLLGQEDWIYISQRVYPFLINHFNLKHLAGKLVCKSVLLFKKFWIYKYVLLLFYDFWISFFFATLLLTWLLDLCYC